jgi:L-rhamnonate dehydratase
MRITEVRTRVVQWRGKTVPLPPHFCTNPMDLLALPQTSMQTFTFHGWLIVEVFTDTGHVGIGNAALSPQVTKQVIDSYLSPLLIGQDPWDVEFLWQHMYRKTIAFGRKGIGMVAISAVDIALWDVLGKAAQQPVYRLLGGRTKARIPVYASRLYSTPLDELAAEARRYKQNGYLAMKLRFGWGPADGAEGMRRNLDLVRTVREAVGDGIDIMADAYMGWTLDYAKRMLPLLEPFNLRWLEEPVIPDDIHVRGVEGVRASADRRRRARVHAAWVPPSPRGTRRGLHPIRYESCWRPDAGAQDHGAGRGASGARDSACRPDAQLPCGDGQPELAHGRALSDGRRRGGQ